MQRLAERAGEDGARYGDLRRALLAQIRACYWDAERQAFVDSFTSGRRHVTRQGNVFAILFDLVDRQTQELLCRSVLENPEIPPITTPYFQFFELEALCRLGRLARVMQTIRSYWGGMLSCGATTFWEEYDPAKPLEAQYAMYGDPYGKSLCHAWAASPIYLLARYFVGLRLHPDGSFTLDPAPGFFTRFSGVFPLKDGQLHVSLQDGVWSTKLA